MKKSIIFIIIIVLIFVGAFAVYKIKMKTVENAVIDFLINERDVLEENIVSVKGNIANLPGEKNWMIGVKLKDDEKTYFYYKDKNDKVMLESYVLNGHEYIE